MVKRYGAGLIDALAEGDSFFGTGDQRLLREVLEEGGTRTRQLIISSPAGLHSAAEPRVDSWAPQTSFLKISEGCDHTCAFCAIPSFRGLHRSAPLRELVLEAQALARQGVK